MNRDFKGIWIPKEIWLCKDLSAIDKVIYAEICSLDNDEHCTASNEYFAEFCDCGIATVTRSINKLIKLGYIEIVSFDGRHRVIKMIRQPNQIDEAPSSKCNAINIDNNIDNTIKKENKKKDTFTPPTIAEVKEYAKTNCTNVDADYFYNFFSTGNWHDSNGKQVKNWKQKMITWNSYHNNSYSRTQKTYKDNIQEHTKSEDDILTERYLREFESYDIDDRPDYKEWAKEQRLKDKGVLFDV